MDGFPVNGDDASAVYGGGLHPHSRAKYPAEQVGVDAVQRPSDHGFRGKSLQVDTEISNSCVGRVTYPFCDREVSLRPGGR